MGSKFAAYVGHQWFFSGDIRKQRLSANPPRTRSRCFRLQFGLRL